MGTGRGLLGKEESKGSSAVAALPPWALSLNLARDLQLQLTAGHHAAGLSPGGVSHRGPYLGYFSGVLLGLMQPKKERDMQIKIPSLSRVLMQIDKNNI